MKNHYTYFVLFVLTASFFLLTGYGAGPATVTGASYTGAPGESGVLCSNCHGTPGAYGGVSSNVEIFEQGTSTLATVYTSGTTYDIVVTINHNINTPIGFGFQCVAVDASGTNVGTFQNPSPNAKVVTGAGGVMIAEHSSLSVSNVFEWEWVAPTFLLAVDVTFYSTGAAVNANGSNSGDSGTSLSGTITITSEIVPVELIDFTATNIDNNYHLIEWATATEQNADYFIVEHSLDGKTFTPIADIKAVGNTLERQDYDFRFMQAQNGSNYYRLTQVDKDGLTQLFKTVNVYQFKELELVKLYPIPATTTVNMDIRYQDSGEFNLSITNTAGKVVLEDRVYISEGINSFQLDLSNLLSGTYIVMVTNGESQFTSTILKF